MKTGINSLFNTAFLMAFLTSSGEETVPFSKNSSITCSSTSESLFINSSYAFSTSGSPSTSSVLYVSPVLSISQIYFLFSTTSITPIKSASRPTGSCIFNVLALNLSSIISMALSGSAPSLSSLLIKTMRGTLYLSA